MNEKFDDFLMNSSLAHNLEIKPRIIVYETNFSPEDCLNEEKIKMLENIKSNNKICRLSIGNSQIASGRIIKKKGEYYFQIKKILKEEE